MTARNFKFGAITLPDIDPSIPPDEIRKAYSSQYPALTNATVTRVFDKEGSEDYEIKEKSQTYEIKPSVGRKG